MGITEVLTIVFVIMKCLGYITWSWWLVFLPEIVGAGFYVLFAAAAIAGAIKFSKKGF